MLPDPPEYLANLRRHLAESEPGRQHTRARIVLGVAEALSARGYHDAIVREVCADLVLSRGAFYQYFENRTEAVAEVLDGFCDFVYEQSIGIGRGRSDFERIYEVTLFYILLYAKNRGLFAVQYKLARENSRYSRGWRRLQDRWRGRLANYILRVTGADRAAQPQALALAYMLTSMADDLLFRLIFEREEKIDWLHGQPRRMAAMIAAVWYRAIFGRDPEPEALEGGVEIGYSGALPLVSSGER
jgi:AcrR family transcriptional regulator